MARQQINLRLPSEWVERAEEMAQKSGGLFSRTNVLRAALAYGLKEFFERGEVLVTSPTPSKPKRGRR